MCRKNRVLGWCLIAAGLGSLLTLILGSGFLAVVLALILVGSGLWLSGKR